MSSPASPYRVLFVCTGNTCRSPMAAHVLRRDLADAGLAADVASAGLRVAAEGQPADPRAQDVLRAHGYGVEHQTTRFSPAMLASYDLVIALDSMHAWVLCQAAQDGETAKIRLLGSFDPAAGAGWDVPDPVAGGRADYERVLELLRAAMPGIVAAVRASQPGPPSAGRSRQ
jgi:protein-tyrosine phosphatase